MTEAKLNPRETLTACPTPQVRSTFSSRWSFIGNCERMFIGSERRLSRIVPVPGARHSSPPLLTAHPISAPEDAPAARPVARQFVPAIARASRAAFAAMNDSCPVAPGVTGVAVGLPASAPLGADGAILHRTDNVAALYLGDRPRRHAGEIGR
jgi:hypothetical protein